MKVAMVSSLAVKQLKEQHSGKKTWIYDKTLAEILLCSYAKSATLGSKLYYWLPIEMRHLVVQQIPPTKISKLRDTHG